MSSSPNISVRPEYEAELVDRTNQLLQRAGDQAVEDRAVERQQRQEYRESAAYHGGWVPGGASEEQRQELRGDYERRQQWNGLIESGTASANASARSIEDMKPPAEMTEPEIVTEARDIHAHFTQLMERFEGTPSGPERSQIREEMKPLVIRENELREEYTGRVKAEMSPVELSQDRVPEQSIGYAR